MAPRDERVRVLGPAEAPLALVRGRHRFRLLVKSPRNFDLSAYLREWLAARPQAQGHAQARSRRRSAELFLSMIPKSVQRFSEKIMLKLERGDVDMLGRQA